MLQEIIVYIIIAVVFAFLVRGAVRMFIKKSDGGSPCSGCSGCDIKPGKGNDKDNHSTSCGK